MRQKDTYKIGPFESKRTKPVEEEVDVKNFNPQWKFIDTNLGHPLEVILTEFVDFRKKTASVSAEVSYDNSKLNPSEVSDYVKKQLKQIAEDGKAFPD